MARVELGREAAGGGEEEGRVEVQRQVCPPPAQWAYERREAERRRGRAQRDRWMTWRRKSQGPKGREDGRERESEE